MGGVQSRGSHVNIFLQLSRWAARQGENFATDSLAIALSHLLTHDPEIAGPVLNLLTGGLFTTGDARQREIKIDTQKTGGAGLGTPDLWVESPDKLALVEVKTGSPLGRDQLRNYRTILDTSSCPMTRLILLTQYLIPLGAHPPDHSVRWYQLAQLLADQCTRTSCSQTSFYLVSQLLEFLRSWDLALHEVSSEISESIRQHHMMAGETSITNKRIKSLRRLVAYEELRPLHDVLYLMGSVLDNLEIEPKPMLDSGQSTGGWIGYNIQNMKYWLCIYYSSPDTVVFETRLWPGEERPMAHPPFGEYYFRWKATYWRNLLNLGSDNDRFFSLAPEEQFSELYEFTKRSLDQAQVEHSAAS
jgi:hypothetical protein